MRPPVTRERVQAFARALSRRIDEPVVIYLTGGATAVIEGWRASTIDIDLRLEPEPEAALRAIAELKNELAMNLEFASPPDFVPELDGWRERSPFVLQEGRVVVRHFDPYSQALAKIERGFEQDRADVDAMIAAGLIDVDHARLLFTDVEARLLRYPAIDAGALRQAIDEALGE